MEGENISAFENKGLHASGGLSPTVSVAVGALLLVESGGHAADSSPTLGHKSGVETRLVGT